MSSIVDDESVLIFFSFFLFFHLLFHHRVISVLFSIFSSVILSSCHLFLLFSFTFLLILSCHLFLLSYFSFRIIFVMMLSLFYLVTFHFVFDASNLSNNHLFFPSGLSCSPFLFRSSHSVCPALYHLLFRTTGLYHLFFRTTGFYHLLYHRFLSRFPSYCRSVTFSFLLSAFITFQFYRIFVPVYLVPLPLSWLPYLHFSIL